MEANILIIALCLIALILFFDFINGFSDGANMMVTPVITGALEPRRALLIAVFEFVGAWFLGTAVAQTLGKGESLRHRDDRHPAQSYPGVE